jgi:hypothetical protein
MRDGNAKNILMGVGAGVAGTALVQGMLAGTKRWIPETLPPMKDDPAHFMVEKARQMLPSGMREKIPGKAKKAVERGLPFGYGTAFATAYALGRKADKNTLLDGAALGLFTWAAGYLGWLPATKLMPPVWKQEAKQVLPNVLSHIVFGIATVAAVKWLKQRL